MKQLKGILQNAAILLSIFLISCNDDDPTPEIPLGSKGYFIVNEGGWGKGNTSLSFFDRETGIVTNDVFEKANDIPLGDQSQSMSIHNDEGFIVVQNSEKIEVINVDDFTIIATISDDIVSPRYFVGVSDIKGYVSDWGADSKTGTVKVIDLTSYKVTKTIATGQGTNRLLHSGTSLYAVNAGGAGRDNTIKVIDTSTDEITKTITITDNPNSLQQDADGNLWVATTGHTQYDEVWNVVAEESTSGALVKLDASGKETLRLNFEGLIGAKSLTINKAGTKLYYNSSGAVYSMSTSAESLPTTKFIDKKFYGLAVDPIDDTIIGCEAPNFSSSGNILIYNDQGQLQETHAVGIGPNGCTFK